MGELAAFWIITSILYLGSAIYVQREYRDVLPSTISIALFCFGAAIFLSINWRFIEIGDIEPAFEALVIALFVISWVLLMRALKTVAKTFREHEVSYE